MYHRIQKYFAGISPMWIDGSLYVLLAIFGAILLTFNNDDAYKYINATVVYWVKNTVGWMIAGLTALKMFRSTAFADHLNKQAMKDAGVKPAPIAPPVPDPVQMVLNKSQLETAVINKINEKTNT